MMIEGRLEDFRLLCARATAAWIAGSAPGNDELKLLPVRPSDALLHAAGDQKNQRQHDRDADQRLLGNGAREFHDVFRHA